MQKKVIHITIKNDKSFPILSHWFLSNGEINTSYLNHRYPAFTELQAIGRSGYTRYDHTLNLIKGYYCLLTNNYADFVRLSEAAKQRGEHVITKNQFDWIAKTAKSLSLSDSDKLFILLLALTHDYGTRSGDAKHFIQSGIDCIEEFAKEMFSSEKIKLASLIVANHSYIGDNLLGEGTPAYGLDLYNSIPKEKQEFFWKQLVLLNILDINAAGDGYLSKEKMDNIHKLFANVNHLQQSKQNWNTELFNFLLPGQDLTSNEEYTRYREQPITNQNEIYLQYFYNIASQLKDQHDFKTLFAVFDLAQRLMDYKDHHILSDFTFITFSGDSTTDVSQLQNGLQTKPKITIHNKNSGNINGINFSITEDGYLTFELG